MTTFTIDDNNITAYASAEQANRGDAAGLIHFDAQTALAKVSALWPLSRLVEIWNGIPGQTPVKKFQDRNKAVTRVWRAIQSLAPQELPEPTTPKPEAQPQAGKRRKPAEKAGRAKQTGRANPTQKPMADRPNKKAEVIALMMRAKGSTLAEIMEATRWQKHTVRGFVSLLGSRDSLTIHSALNAAGERTYTITN